jgi:dimethylargininase
MTTSTDLLALTRAVSPTIDRCVLTHQPRQPIDVALAERQHRAYEDRLSALGVTVIRVPAAPDLPDAVFVEDTAVVVDELAVLAAPGVRSRQAEVESVGAGLARYRPLRRIKAPGTLDGGDVLRIDRSLFVGLSARTNRQGVDQLARLLAPHGYAVCPVALDGCLHLKTACTYLGRGTLLANPEWADLAPFHDFAVIAVPASEPGAANALAVADRVLLPASFALTGRLLERHGFRVERLDVSELQKAEAGLTCCSILFRDHGGDSAMRDGDRGLA